MMDVCGIESVGTPWGLQPQFNHTGCAKRCVPLHVNGRCVSSQANERFVQQHVNGRRVPLRVFTLVTRASKN